jgi:hypothetical protein
MTEEINGRVQRHDRDLVQGVVPVADSDDQKLRKLHAHLSRPITAAEANGKVPLHGDALRRHADLANNAHEHPMVAIRRRLREERESA